MNPPAASILVNMKTTITLLLLSLFAASFMIAAEIPAVGSNAPDFTLNSQENKAISLHDYKGKWVVLYFYPKDQTRGCTIEAQNFQRDLGQFTAKNAVILGVSVDNAESHQAFCAKESLTFKLLADDKKEVTTKYGSLKDYGAAMGQAAARNTFLIDPQGNITNFYEVKDIQNHSGELLKAIH
jgi:peroxiredoxin Q/BCP